MLGDSAAEGHPHPGIHSRTAGDEHHPTCGAEHHQAQERGGRATTRHAGYDVSQRKRKRVEQSFGWMKMIGMLKKVKLRGIEKVGWLFTFTGALTTCADCET